MHDLYKNFNCSYLRYRFLWFILKFMNRVLWRVKIVTAFNFHGNINFIHLSAISNPEFVNPMGIVGGSSPGISPVPNMYLCSDESVSHMISTCQALDYQRQKVLEDLHTLSIMQRNKDYDKFWINSEKWWHVKSIYSWPKNFKFTN